MRVVILTTVDRGLASACLPALVAAPDVEVALVIQADATPARPWRHRAKKLRKLIRIGPLGAALGVRMRAWYTTDVTKLLELDSLAVLARRHGVRHERTPGVNTAETRLLMRQADADLGLSLGNPYIGPGVFEAPRFGMINIHHELLPEFRGAQSVVWQLHQGSAVTGFTIHQVSRGIDEGAILWRESRPIRFGATLRETVTQSYALLISESARILPLVIRDYEAISARARPQTGGRSYTTPGFREFLEIRRQHRRLAGVAAAARPLPR